MCMYILHFLLDGVARHAMQRWYPFCKMRLLGSIPNLLNPTASGCGSTSLLGNDVTNHYTIKTADACFHM